MIDNKIPEEELEAQDVEIRLKLAYVFAPIAIMVIAIAYFQNNSLSFTKRKYQEQLGIEFSGQVSDKYEEGDYPRATRYVILENGHRQNVSSFIYDKLQIGDSLLKEKGKDTLYFYLQTKEILQIDFTQSERERYLRVKNEKANKN